MFAFTVHFEAFVKKCIQRFLTKMQLNDITTDIRCCTKLHITYIVGWLNVEEKINEWSCFFWEHFELLVNYVVVFS